MNFAGRIVLSYLEEDNIQRAYFRVRPLLTEAGAVTQADIDALPDEGYLRVVPDKNEQHTFKERMRELGMLCVLDLLNLPQDAVKIRTNKNYAPQRGENNQYIVYSDAVQAVPQQVFFEVVSAETGEKEKISRAVTPLCYLRSGGRIYGPVSRATGLEQEGAAPLAPDSEGIYAVTLPDGAEKLFYWPRREHAVSDQQQDAPANAAEAPASEAPAPQKLSGMPLYQTVARRPLVPQRAHNPLVDAVGQQLRAGRVEAPGAVVSAGASMRPVENPMDAFRHSLERLWAIPDMQRQAAAHFLSMTGVQTVINQQLCSRGSDAVAQAMNSQIQDLEAERLALLMQLESARKDLGTLRQEAICQASTAEKDALRRLQQQSADARQELEKLEVAEAALLEKRDALLAELAKADPDTLYIKAELGGYADPDTLCERVRNALAAAGVACDKNDAVHLLTLLCVSPKRIEFAADTRADALAAASAFASALGVTASNADSALAVRVQDGGDSFRMAVAMYDIAPAGGYTKLIVSLPDTDEGHTEYALDPWPVAQLKAAGGWKFPDAPTFPPVKAEAVRDAVLKGGVEPPAPILALLDDIQKALTASGAPLPQSVRRQMFAYLSAAAPRMEGGIADAVDYAFSAWIVPHLRRCGGKADDIVPLVQELPRTLKRLERLPND